MDNVPETRQKLSIFLSHSHKDIEKVRKLRDILEFLDCEPLMFYLKCLDEDNDELNTFIMREIEARNIFIYCRSKNSESSAWVQKELAYIRSLDSKRLYTVDIDGNLAYGMLGVLEKITGIIKRNQVFLSCSLRDGDMMDRISERLLEEGYNVYLAEDILVEVAVANYMESIMDKIRDVMKNGAFMPLITPNYCKSISCIKELEFAAGLDGLILPVLVGDVEMPVQLQNVQPVRISKKVNIDDLARILQALRTIK